MWRSHLSINTEIQSRTTKLVSGLSRAEEVTLYTEAEHREPEAVAAGPVISGRYGRDDKL